MGEGGKKEGWRKEKERFLNGHMYPSTNRSILKIRKTKPKKKKTKKPLHYFIFVFLCEI